MSQLGIGLDIVDVASITNKTFKFYKKSIIKIHQFQGAAAKKPVAGQSKISAFFTKK